MKTIQGFNVIHVEKLMPNQFFFFPKGKKRMVAEKVSVGINYTKIIATSPKGNTYTRDVLNCTEIYVYK